MTHNSSSAASGDLFVAPQFGPAQDGPMLCDPAGNLIWFKAMPKGTVATDFRVQRFGGQPVLTWWQGYLNHGLGEEVEYHDLARDPLELHNVAARLSPARVLRLHRGLRALERCHGGPACWAAMHFAGAG